MPVPEDPRRALALPLTEENRPAWQQWPALQKMEWPEKQALVNHPRPPHVLTLDIRVPRQDEA
ncbi:hypothetical protein BDW_09895 [Bdellovibrio bacteriovorus W]|nr:hypothetical protein BDW_09895 [Bdellovibrio bacteriovorus W]